MSSPRRALVQPLSHYERLLEVGIGNRPGLASALADRGHDVLAIDIDIGDRVRAAADEPSDGSLHAMRADVLGLADGRGCSEPDQFALTTPDPVEAVYACNLPAELQRPTVALAERLDAACLFTTLGFEEPTVTVSRRSVAGTTLYIAREGTEHGDGGAACGSDTSR